MDPFRHEMNELLVSTYREITRIEELVLRRLSKNTLSIAELHMLDAIGRTGCTVTDIARSMGISMPSATIAVKKLEQKGYVTKDRDPDDARRVCIRLTLEGRKAEAAHHWFHRQMVSNIEKAFSHDEKDMLLKTIGAMNTFFTQRAHELEQIYSLDNEHPSVLDANQLGQSDASDEA